MSTYEQQREWQKRNPERWREIQRKSYKKNFERTRGTRNARSKKWREDNPEKTRAQADRYRAKHPERAKATNRLRMAVFHGKIFKPDACSECKRILPKRQIQGHHEDYERWWDVIWLCRKCHGKRA